MHIVGRIEELASTAAQREEGPFLKWLYSGIYVPWHCKTQIFIHDSMQYSASKKVLQLFGVVAELRVHFCWQPSTQKNDIMIFQTNWILIFIQPSQKWIIKQFASCQNVSQVGITLFKDIFKGANSCQWCSFGQGYEYGKRGDLSIFKTSWFEFAMRRRRTQTGSYPSIFFYLQWDHFAQKFWVPRQPCQRGRWSAWCVGLGVRGPRLLSRGLTAPAPFLNSLPVKCLCK